MVTTATDPHVMLQQPVIVTSNKVNAGPLVLKTALGGQGKKFSGKGKSIKPTDKGKKPAVKTTTCAVTSAGPSSNLRSKLRDKANVNFRNWLFILLFWYYPIIFKYGIINGYLD